MRGARARPLGRPKPGHEHLDASRKEAPGRDPPKKTKIFEGEFEVLLLESFHRIRAV